MIDAALAGIGFSRAFLETAVEERLRENGVDVLDLATSRYGPELHVSVRAIETAGFPFCASVKLLERTITQTRIPFDAVTESLVEFISRVELHRAATWEAGVLASAPSVGAQNFIRDRILELVQQFSDDFRAVNP